MAHVLQVMSDKRFQMGAEEALFPLAIGSNWTQLRIGIRHCLAAPRIPYVPQTYLNVPGPHLVFGFCAGNKGWTSPSPNLVLGAWHQNLQSAVSGPHAYYVPSGNNHNVSYRIGPSLSGSVSGQVGASALLPRSPIRNSMILEITKTYDASTTVTATIYTNNSTITATDQTMSTFIEYMRTTGAPTGFTATVALALTPFNLTATQYNTLDTAFVFWSHSIPVLEVFNVAVLRLL